MEPLNDKELNELLHQWHAPAAPEHLESRVLRRREPWWRWFLDGTIRIPVPVGLAIVIAIALLLYLRTPEQSPQQSHSVSLADFQPVRQLEPRIIGRVNENN